MTKKERVEKLKKLAFRGNISAGQPICIHISGGDDRGGRKDVSYMVRWTYKRYAIVCADTGNITYYQYPKKGIEHKGDDLPDYNNMLDERILEVENRPLVRGADPSVNEPLVDPLADDD